LLSIDILVINIILGVILVLLPIVNGFLWVGYLTGKKEITPNKKKYSKKLSILFLILFVIVLLGGISVFISLCFIDNDVLFWCFVEIGTILIFVSLTFLRFYCIYSNKRNSFLFNFLDTFIRFYGI
jgi:uncharacterized membrane protein